MSFHSQGSVAASARRNKEARPEMYCPDSRCLWRVVTNQGRKPCPRHMKAEIDAALADAAEDNSLTELLQASIAAGQERA